MSNDILLESGTGELEIIEFVIGDKHYAINVIKVKEILDVQSSTVTKLPESHPSIAGLILSRNAILTLVDLKYVLDKQSKTDTLSKVIVCEFNKIKVAFSIDDIVGVHRIKWNEILKPDDISVNSLVVGNIIMDEKIILMLDFEKIVTDINPSTGINTDRIVNVDYKDRGNIKIFLADDSPLIRRLLSDTLTKAGFTSLKFFDDGKQALDCLNKIAENKKDRFIEDVQVLITDIEMPQMDGLTLTRTIKENPILSKLPVIIFSSLITDNLRHKGDSVGANAQLSKPEVEQLVDMIDKFIDESVIVPQ
ncbi:two-component system, chemotaxis family, response regulator CheV [Clostridium acidisoli DSM 12555]|jgi:two-component system chemotaxis response regulator CheV|uniref:Stage 0 sporulation protein A homolog n=1 Tax=Clostridium acidisoli DSM 12555 TaxID=1121291 RepID=A0A1W1XMP1_9CLOT|nr:chemotaxis protein [Clostridium acidisoli]SMC25124.1 two-component system, chemotaxis family, response regulator CheV [Clostridium acidisoli DSM 12555]